MKKEKNGNKKISLHTSLIESDDGYTPYFLIEGDAESLKWLAKFIIEIADAKYNDDSISPDGAGNKNFCKTAQFGLYVTKNRNKS
jgi:hypothetical protein